MTHPQIAKDATLAHTLTAILGTAAVPQSLNKVTIDFDQTRSEWRVKVGRKTTSAPILLDALRAMHSKLNPSL